MSASMPSPWTNQRSLTAVALAAIAAVAAWQWAARRSDGERVEVLDPARVVILRTPGGLLEVSAMEKVEEFGWRTSWACPLVDCSSLPQTLSRVRVKAHYVYQIPLAAEWRLQRDGQRYKLTVPAPQLRPPVAFDTKSMEIATDSGLFSPAAAPNRESALRNLGPELAQRGATAAYLEAQRPSAEKTVREFARRWMLEQGRKPDLPIEVRFTAPNPL